MGDFEENIEQLNASTSEDTIATWIDICKKSKSGGESLAQVLPQNHPIYHNRGSNQMNRIRGYIMASFEQIELPNSALMYVFEELENSKDAYMVAASAKALRGLKSPSKTISTYLCKALYNIAHKDNSVNFESYKPQWNTNIKFTTATEEILLTFRWLGNAANEALSFLDDYLNGHIITLDSRLKKLTQETIDIIKNDKRVLNDDCCTPQFVTQPKKVRYEQIKNVILEDQEGQKITFEEFFKDSYSIISFFYTRCDNPNKCSLTISKLAQLQKLIDPSNLKNQIKIAAITYDSAYDKPDRIKIYGEERKFQFNENYKSFRVVGEGFDLLKDYLQLGVNYVGSIVSQHRIELFVLGKNSIVDSEFTQLQWNPADVLNHIKNKTTKSKTIIQNLKKTFQPVLNTLLPIFIAFFPKCPICWAAYLSAFGISGVSWLKYNPKLLFVIILIMLANLGILYYKSKKNQSFIPFKLSMLGTLIVTLSFYLPSLSFLKIIGIILVIGSSSLIVFPLNYYYNIINTFKNIKSYFTFKKYFTLNN